MESKAKIIRNDYKNILNSLSGEKFDLIFIDPPYALNIAVDSIKYIIELNLLADNGIIILETDNEKRELENLQKLNVNVYDLRNYGRVSLIFLNRKG